MQIWRASRAVVHILKSSRTPSSASDVPAGVLPMPRSLAELAIAPGPPGPVATCVPFQYRRTLAPSNTHAMWYQVPSDSDAEAGTVHVAIRWVGAHTISEPA